jgi:hypothetical protein
LHAFVDPPNIAENCFANQEIKYYHACLSIILIYSSVELYVKNAGRRIFEHLHGKDNLQNLPQDQDNDYIFNFRKRNKKKNVLVKQTFSGVLEEFPQQARRRILSLKYVKRR